MFRYASEEWEDNQVAQRIEFTWDKEKTRSVLRRTFCLCVLHHNSPRHKPRVGGENVPATAHFPAHATVEHIRSLFSGFVLETDIEKMCPEMWWAFYTFYQRVEILLHQGASFEIHFEELPDRYIRITRLS